MWVQPEEKVQRNSIFVEVVDLPKEVVANRRERQVVESEDREVQEKNSKSQVQMQSKEQSREE